MKHLKITLIWSLARGSQKKQYCPSGMVLSKWIPKIYFIMLLFNIMVKYYYTFLLSFFKFFFYLKGDIGKHPTCNKLIHQFRLEQKNTEFLLAQLQAGDCYERKKERVAKDLYIQKVVSFETNLVISPENKIPLVYFCERKKSFENRKKALDKLLIS